MGRELDASAKQKTWLGRRWGLFFLLALLSPLPWLHGPPSINFYTPANPIMSSWCKWLDEKRLFTASLYMHMQKKKQLKWAQSTQGWGVGFASEASKKNRIYRLLTASLFTCTQKKNQGKQVQSMQGWGVRLGSGVGLCGLSGGGTGVLMIGKCKAPLICIPRNLAR